MRVDGPSVSHSKKIINVYSYIHILFYKSIALHALGIPYSGKYSEWQPSVYLSLMMNHTIPSHRIASHNIHPITDGTYHSHSTVAISFIAFLLFKFFEAFIFYSFFVVAVVGYLQNKLHLIQLIFHFHKEC